MDWKTNLRVGVGVRARARERENKNNSPNMSWFETGVNPNFRPTRGLFQGLVR